MLEIKQNIELDKYTTFKIGGRADFFAVIKNENELREALAFAKTRKLPIFILGGGSNLLVSDSGVKGLVLKNEIRGFKFSDFDSDTVILEAGAGEVWDDIVLLSVNQGLSGLENLSGIPGTVGGAAVQNAGAYGLEIKDCAVSVRGFNLINGKSFEYNIKDCQYSYRNSIFKKNKNLIITAVLFRLNKKPIININYSSLQAKLGELKDLDARKIREVVLNIRKEKLPDWHKVGTAGSFFQNPIISEEKYKELVLVYKDLPNFPARPGFVKIPIGWVLDKVFNLKGYKIGQAGVHSEHALALINLGKASAKEVQELSEHIKKLVWDKMGIEIFEEVEFIK